MLRARYHTFIGAHGKKFKIAVLVVLAALVLAVAAYLFYLT